MDQTPHDSWFVPPPPPERPVDDWVEASSWLPRGEASVKIVALSLLMLSGLGLGAFLLAYSSVHSGSSQGARMAVGSSQSESPPAAISRDIPAPPANERPMPAPIPAAAESAMAVTSPDKSTLSAVYEPKRAPLAPSVALHPIFVAAPRVTTVVHVEPNPVPVSGTNPYTNPYDVPSTMTASAPSTVTASAPSTVTANAPSAMTANAPASDRQTSARAGEGPSADPWDSRK